MLILPTQGKDFLRRCCTYFGIGGALILELTTQIVVCRGIIVFYYHQDPLIEKLIKEFDVVNFFKQLSL